MKVCRSVLQSVVVCCRVLRCVAVFHKKDFLMEQDVT